MARDIVRFVDHRFRTRRGRRHRAILGHSSGGFGALSLAIEYPDTFGAVGVLSAAANDFEAKAPGAALPSLIERFFLANPSTLGTPVVIPVAAPVPAAAFAALWGSTPGGGSFVTNVVYSLSTAFFSESRQAAILPGSSVQPSGKGDRAGGLQSLDRR